MHSYHQIEVGDKKLNSVYWICAHLVWSEWFLINYAMLGEEAHYPWVKDFEYGSSSEQQDGWPSFEEVRRVLDEYHEKTLEVMKNVSDIDAEVTLGPKWTSPKRDINIHCIRHEGIHAGHLGWLAKLNN